MKLKHIILAIFLIAFTGNIYAQNAPGAEKGNEAVKYLPIHRFPLNVLHVYKFTDSTKVTSYLPDSTSVTHLRVVTHFFTLMQTKKKEDGFLTIEASIDSTRYYLKEGRAEIFWDSQDDASGGINMQDLKYATVPLGKYYNMVISPYGEVAKIYGEKIDWFIDYLNKYADQLNDSVEKFIWYDGVSIQRLSSITEIKKINFPIEKIEMDSTWRTPFAMQFEFINFRDTVDAKIIDFTNGYFTIEAQSKNMRAVPGNYLIYGINNMLLPIEESSGEGVYTLKLTPRGAIEKADGHFLLNLTVPVKKDKFRLKIESTLSWELFGQYKL